MRRYPPYQFKTPIQKAWASLVAPLIAGGGFAVAGCLIVFAFLLLLIWLFFTLVVALWQILASFGIPYAMEIAVVCAVLIYTLAGFLTLLAQKKFLTRPPTV